MSMRLLIDTTAGPLELGVAECGAAGAVVSRWIGSSSLSTCEDFPRGLGGVLDSAGVPLSSIKELVIGQGPGSFTGLRIGYSFVKGLSLALGVPIVQVASLAAYSLSAHARWGAVVLDARRGEYFTQFFTSAAPVGAVSILTAQQVEAHLRSPSFSESSEPVTIKGPETMGPSVDAEWVAVTDRIWCLQQAAERGAPYVRLEGPTSPSYVREIAAKTIEERARGQF